MSNLKSILDKEIKLFVYNNEALIFTNYQVYH